MKALLAILPLLLLAACAQNRANPAPNLPSQPAYAEVAGFYIEVDLWLFTWETPALHCFITYKDANSQNFGTVQKLKTPKADGSHYYHDPHYSGYRAWRVILTAAQAERVISVARSSWAQALARDYDLLRDNSNEFVAKILERAEVEVKLPWQALGK